MVINNVCFSEIKSGNEVIFVPHIIRGRDDGGVIFNFKNFFGLIETPVSYKGFLYEDCLAFLCTGDTYRYVIPYKLDEFCKKYGYTLRNRKRRNAK